MSDRLGWDERANATTVVTALVLLALFLSGPVGPVDFTGSSPELGDGTASVTVVEPSGDRVRMTPGRFGADVMYTRLPDLVADVDSVTGQPRLVYTITVPELGIDRTEQRLVRSTGRLRISMQDRALPRGRLGEPENRPYDGQLVVRVQSFSGQHVVVNRSIEVVTS